MDCLGPIDLGQEGRIRGEAERLLLQREPHCWPELWNVTWWNFVNVGVQCVIWRISHRNKKQRDYPREGPRKQGMDAILWFYRGTVRTDILTWIVFSKFQPLLKTLLCIHPVKIARPAILPSNIFLRWPSPNTHTNNKNLPLNSWPNIFVKKFCRNPGILSSVLIFLMC